MVTKCSASPDLSAVCISGVVAGHQLPGELTCVKLTFTLHIDLLKDERHDVLGVDVPVTCDVLDGL